MADLTIARGTCYPLFAYDAAYTIDLDAAERRVLAAKERQTVKSKRRAPAFFEYRPRPLRVAQESVPVAIGSYRTAPSVEVVLYDFGAVSVSYAISIEGPLAVLPQLSADLWGNQELMADSRAQVERLLRTLGDAAIRPRIADFVEDYSVFQIEAFREAYGDKPTELQIMFPTDDDLMFADANYKAYSMTHGLICKGDGETADARWDMDRNGIVVAEGRSRGLRARDAARPFALRILRGESELKAHVSNKSSPHRRHLRAVRVRRTVITIQYGDLAPDLAD